MEKVCVEHTFSCVAGMYLTNGTKRNMPVILSSCSLSPMRRLMPPEAATISGKCKYRLGPPDEKVGGVLVDGWMVVLCTVCGRKWG